MNLLEYKRGQVERTKFAERNLRGQVAAEFMLYIAVFMVLVIAAMIVINNIQSSDVPLRENTVAIGVGQGFVQTISLAVEAGRGFSYNYTFPKTIFGAPYEITMPDNNNNTLLIWYGPYGNFSYSYKLPSYNYKWTEGNCIHMDVTEKKDVISSNMCGNLLILNNDGQNLTINQSQGA